MLKLRNKLIVICALHLLFFGLYVLLNPSIQKSTHLYKLSLYTSSNGSQAQEPEKVYETANKTETKSPVGELGAEQTEGKNESTDAVEGIRNEKSSQLRMAEDMKENEDENIKFAYEDVNDITPSDFIEIKKIVPKKTKEIGEKGGSAPAWKKYRKGLAPNSFMKPNELRKRYENIKTSGKNPELVAFVEEQERRKARVKLECDRPDNAPKSQQGDNMGPPASLSSQHNILLDRKASSLSNLSTLHLPRPSPLVAAAHIEQRREGRLRALLRNIKRGAGTFLFASYQVLIVDKKNYLTFCPVYKAASTSWSINLLLLNDAWSETKSVELQSVLRQVFPRVSNLAGPMMTEGTTRFLVVRHPFDRFVSCYRDKFENATRAFYYRRYGQVMVSRFRALPPNISPSQGKILLHQVNEYVDSGKSNDTEALRDNPYAHPIGPTFTEFAKYVVTSRSNDEHWRPYDLHCSLCYIDYDFILKFENMYNEGRYFITYINQTEKIKPRWDNPTMDGATTIRMSRRYFNQLPTYLVKLLIRKYKKDFDLFEYSPKEYLTMAFDFGQEQAKNNVSLPLT